MAHPGDLFAAAPDDPDAAAAARPEDDREADASHAVTALYRGHALGLTRLAFIMLGDRQAAEDVVQEAFCGLYRAWNRLPDHGNVHGYLRVSVLNGCRSALRRSRRIPRPLALPAAASAEAEALAGEEQRATIAAPRRLPPRQREALALRYFAELPEYETALAMGSAAARSNRRPPGPWPRWAGYSGRTSDCAGRPAPPGSAGRVRADHPGQPPGPAPARPRGAPGRPPPAYRPVARGPTGRRRAPRSPAALAGLGEATGAAAAVIAVIAGAPALSRTIQGQPPMAGIPPDYSSAPPYYAYGIQGDIYSYVSNGTQNSASVQGRYIKVRATSTGELLATVSPPRPYNDFSVLTGAADGRVFVFGARRYWQRNAGPSPRLAARNQTTPMVFRLLRISAGGHPQLSTLTLPETLTPQQQPSVALSPDGTRLAVAFYRGTSAVVQVITLGSGQVRTWAQPRASWHPSLAGQGAWSGNGRTLLVGEEPGTFFPPTGPVMRHPMPTSRVLLLDTNAPGAGPPTGQVLVLHAPAGKLAPTAVFLAPDGVTLIGTVPTDQPGGSSAGALAVYSARTGSLLRTLAAWQWPRIPSPPGRGGYPRPQVAWSNVTGSQLIVLQPRNQLNVLGVLSDGSFAGRGSAMLPGSAAGYRELQYALRIGSQMTW